MIENQNQRARTTATIQARKAERDRGSPDTQANAIRRAESKRARQAERQAKGMRK